MNTKASALKWGKIRTLEAGAPDGAGILHAFITAFAQSLHLVAVDIHLQLHQHSEKGNFGRNIFNIYSEVNSWSCSMNIVRFLV